MPSTTIVSRLILLLVVELLLAGCQNAERALAPPPDRPQFSQSPDDQSRGQRLKGRIAFHSNRDGDFEIFVMKADGSEQTQLTHNAFQEFDPNWSPNGKRIAFSSDRDGDFEVFAMNADGSRVTQLTHNVGVDDGPTAWAPNGKQIAFISTRDGDKEIFVMNDDGTRVTQLTSNNVDDEGDHAGWSPDGKLFLFSSRRDGGDLDIFVMKLDGTGVRQLTGKGGDFADADDAFWSPDGKRIAFHSNRDGDEEIYVMNADGGGLIKLTDNTAQADGVPSWTKRKRH
jgi:Tol biopolymer transport system component